MRMTSNIVKISAWGNSHGIRLSRELMQAMQITPDTPLEMQVVAPGRVELRVASIKMTLAQKLKAFDPAIHSGELLADAPSGTEFGAR